MNTGDSIHTIFCRWAYTLTEKPKYLNCLLEEELDIGDLRAVRRLLVEGFLPKSDDKSVDQTPFAYTYFLYGEYLLRCDQPTMAKPHMKKGFDLALSARSRETPKMFRRTLDCKIYKSLDNDPEFTNLKEQLKAQSVNNFITRSALLNYFSRGDKTKENAIAAEMGWK